MTWGESHELTKYSAESLRRNRHALDWENMPDPFRHYEGTPVLDLPADPPGPEIPALELLQGSHGATVTPDGAADCHGDRGYRYAYFEAGAIGHRLYIAAEAMGLGATGIGAFFDDEVHRYLGLASGQVVYHFAIGHPDPDPRVAAE